MSTPMDWQPSKAIQAKRGAFEKNLLPGGLKTRKGDPGKNGMKKKWKNNKRKRSKYAKSIDHRCDTQSVLNSRASSDSSTIKRFYFLQIFERDTAPCPQQRPWCVFKWRHPQKRNLSKYMSEHEPLRAQYSNVLSVPVKLCLQIANHHAFQSIHTCIIMHPICSCIW